MRNPIISDPVETYDLQLQETNHRCSNDLQLIVSLLAMQSRRTTNEEARAALDDVTSRVAILARARTELGHGRQPNLTTASRQACEALHSQAEPRGILVSLTMESEVDGLSSKEIVPLVLCLNELATNAIKHAFAHDRTGRIDIIVHQATNGDVVIVVDDDGLPMPDTLKAGKGGLGIGLVTRLIASIGGTLTPPANGTKRFEMLVPTD